MKMASIFDRIVVSRSENPTKEAYTGFSTLIKINQKLDQNKNIHPLPYTRGYLLSYLSITKRGSTSDKLWSKDIGISTVFVLNIN